MSLPSLCCSLKVEHYDTKILSRFRLLDRSPAKEKAALGLPGVRLEPGAELWPHQQLLVTGDRAEGAAETLTLWAGEVLRGSGEKIFREYGGGKARESRSFKTPSPPPKKI